jgi:hypothetical protein
LAGQLVSETYKHEIQHGKRLKTQLWQLRKTQQHVTSPIPNVGQATIGRCWLRPPSIGTTIAMLQMHLVSEMVGAGRILTKLARRKKSEKKNGEAS